MGLVLVSHDLAVVEFLCDRVMTMYAGATVELAASTGIRSRPRHPYTNALLHSRLGHGGARQGPRRDPRRVAGGRVVARRLPVLAALPVRDRRLQGRRTSRRPGSSAVT